jgi:uncharacterized protein (DUF2141 family)
MFLTIVPLLLGATEMSTLEVDLDGLRNEKGAIQACLTQDPRHFPDCKADPHAIKQSIPTDRGRLLFTALPTGQYAVALFHDENANAKFDTLMGIPREGFGFSRNPVVRFGAPRFDKVSIQLGPGYTRIRVRLQYML